MSELTIVRPTSAALREVSTEELRSRLAGALQITAESLEHLALIWGELDRRGEDLSGLRSGLAAYLPLIASERLLPGLVVRHAGQAMLLKSLSQMPLAEQRRIFERGTVTVVEVTTEGAVREAEVPTPTLTSAQVRRIFAGDRLRTPAEQTTLLAPRAKRTAPGTRHVEVRIRLTSAEHDALAKAARAAGQQSKSFIRSVLIKQGVLPTREAGDAE